MTDTSRLNAEWITLNAIRGTMQIATKSNATKSTYDNALELGGEIYPSLLGRDVSILRRERESNTAKEYRQKAALKTIKLQNETSAVSLIQNDINELEELLSIAKQERQEKAQVDQLKRRLNTLVEAEKELNPVPHTENQLIFRDALAIERTAPILGSGQAYQDFELPDSNILRIRVLHPDKPEHITGADIIYEKHNKEEECARIVAVQYKIWENKILYLSGQDGERMQKQLNRLKKFTCDKSICQQSIKENTYRFPYCAGFLRPTDKLQRADQKFISSGEHLPICKISECQTKGVCGADIINYGSIRDISLSSEIFEQLFNKEKIGSRLLTYEELWKLYEEHQIATSKNTVVIYAQEFPGDD